MVRRSKKSAPKRTSRRDIDSLPDNRGDLPHRPKRTYVTRSIALPRTTQMVTWRQSAEGTIVASASAVVTQQFAFTLSSLDQYTTFTALFDQYRIDAIRFAVVPCANALGLSDAINYQPLYCVIDYDDNVALSSVAVARQYDNLIELGVGESLERTFAPKIQVQTNLANTTTGGISNIGPQWLDCNTAGIYHYGVKLLVPQGNADNKWDIFVEYYVSFASVR